MAEERMHELEEVGRFLLLMILEQSPLFARVEATKLIAHLSKNAPITGKEMTDEIGVPLVNYVKMMGGDRSLVNGIMRLVRTEGATTEE